MRFSLIRHQWSRCPCMMMSSNGNIFRVTGPLCREFTGHRLIPRTNASDAWINGWVNNHEAGDLRRHRAHYYVIIMECCRNRCHMTDIDILDRRTPNFDPEVFYSKVWGKIFSQLTEKELWPKRRHRNCFFAVVSSCYRSLITLLIKSFMMTSSYGNSFPRYWPFVTGEFP